MAQDNFISESDLSELTDSEQHTANQFSSKENIRVKTEAYNNCISSIDNSSSSIQNSLKYNIHIKKEAVNSIDSLRENSSINNSANPDSNSNFLIAPESGITNNQNSNPTVSEKQISKNFNISSTIESINSANQTLANQVSQNTNSRLTNETSATNSRSDEVFRRVRQLESTIDLDKWNLEQLKEPINEVEVQALEIIYLKRLIKLGLRSPHLKCLCLSKEFLKANQSMVPEMSGRYMSSRTPESSTTHTKVTASDQLKKSIKAMVRPAQIQTRPLNNNPSNFSRQNSTSGARRHLPRHSPVHSPYQQQTHFQFQNRLTGPSAPRPRGNYHNNGHHFSNNHQQSWINNHQSRREYFSDNDQYHPIQHFDFIMKDLQTRSSHNQQQKHFNNHHHHYDQYHQFYNPQQHYHNNHINY